ncbi:unnamed protein product, partial [marine sediment metagenome]
TLIIVAADFKGVHDRYYDYISTIVTTLEISKSHIKSIIEAI